MAALQILQCRTHVPQYPSPIPSVFYTCSLWKLSEIYIHFVYKTHLRKKMS